MDQRSRWAVGSNDPDPLTEDIYYGRCIDVCLYQESYLRRESKEVGRMELLYTMRNAMTVDELAEELDSLWAGLPESDKAMAILANSPETVGAIRETSRKQAIDVTRRGAGLGAESTAIVVSLAPVVAKIIKDLWDHYFLPRIRQKYGEDIIQPK